MLVCFLPDQRVISWFRINEMTDSLATLSGSYGIFHLAWEYHTVSHGTQGILSGRARIKVLRTVTGKEQLGKTENFV